MNLKWAPFDNILYQYEGNRNFHFLDPETENESRLVPNDSVGFMFNPCYSPDKQKIAVYWHRREKDKQVSGLWIISLLDSSQLLLKRGFMRPVGWSSNGEWIYAIYHERPDEIIKINVADGREKHFYTLPFVDATVQIAYSIVISADEKTVVTIEENQQEDVWLIENYDPGLE